MNSNRYNIFGQKIIGGNLEKSVKWRI